MIQKTTYRLVSQFGQIRCPMTVPTSIAIEQLMVAPLVNASVIAYSRIISGDEWPQVKEKTKETFIPVTVNGLMVTIIILVRLLAKTCLYIKCIEAKEMK